MAKVQVVMALTIDGFLPREDEELMQWVKENRQYGFPYWQEKAMMLLFPHYPLSRLFNRKKEDTVFLAQVIDTEMVELMRGLLIYNLVDEIVLYLLPLSYGKGYQFPQSFQPGKWQLYKVRSFRNGICRLAYHRIAEDMK